MGTPETGLWDNDASVDAVGLLIRIPPGQDLPRLLVAKGLELWFGLLESRQFSRSIERRSKEVVALPKPLFHELAAVAQAGATPRNSSRSAAHRAVLGSRCDGYRMNPLFAYPEALVLLTQLAEKHAAKLDRVFAAKLQADYQSRFAPLGVLLEFTNVGLFVDAARVDEWRKGFAAMNSQTKTERPWGDEYCAQVESLFSMLAKPAAKN